MALSDSPRHLPGDYQLSRHAPTWNLILLTLHMGIHSGQGDGMIQALYSSLHLLNSIYMELQR